VTKYRIYFLVTLVLASGAYWLYVHLSEPEPEAFRNALICQVCGKQLPRADAPCEWCLAKKNREELEAKGKGETVKSSSSNTGKVIVGLSASSLLLAVAFWPRLRNLIHRLEGQQDEFLIFRCARCGRKLRYLASSAGMPGQCPKCKQNCTFPLPD
jgi:DNA-directed RNA polymerase subunit RPC12/RpoP